MAGLIGSGGVIRDSSGQWFYAFMRNIGYGAEAWGLESGLQIAKDLHINHIVVESDSAPLIDSSAVMILICILWELCFRIANPLCFPSLAVCFLTSIEKEIWLLMMIWPREAPIKLAWARCKLPSMPSLVSQEVLDDMNGLVRPRASCCCSWCFKIFLW